MSVAILQTAPIEFGELLVALAAAEGSASHPYTHSYELNADPLANRNLADVLHLLAMLHGPQPGLIETAAERNVLPEAERWFKQTAIAFAAERQFLAQLIVSAGPAPSTPGEAETAAAIMDQRHAMEVIASSDRFGCALGATVALMFDWEAIRAVLDTAAARIGIEAPDMLFPDESETIEILASLTPQPRLDRTLSFGARQLLVQHRGLWDVLEARAAARGQG
ncbi:hypothetical protein [uncultured Sphingomonas sp.]|uniref:DUF6975 family protein n=1 Tax=uncultured Sphingomonas sp. TaxID=158754 RepID=UPI0025F6E93F|nr:hypothetical protein [uncultured Sphingomonas sp.]